VVGGAHGSLALVRSLGRRGIPVCFLTHDHPIAKYSRYADRSFAWDGPDDDGAIEFLKNLARDHQLEGWVLIAAGVGMHFGALMLGTIGERGRMDTTVIADAVNTASRLETATKLYRRQLVARARVSSFDLAKNGSRSRCHLS